MKSLIVNGADFGRGRGVRRGILEAHPQGILTGRSLDDSIRLVSHPDLPGLPEEARA